MLDDLGLVAALEWQAREVSKRTGMLVGLVEENVSDKLARGTQNVRVQDRSRGFEQLLEARICKARAGYDCQKPGRLSLTIQDDGKGFDPVRARGLGW